MRSGYTTVVGLFRNPEQARDAVGALKDVGFSGNDIGILMQDRHEAEDLARETGTEAGTGAATGAVSGGILGGLAGWLVGIGALVIPGIGPFIAAGALGTAIAGAAIGAGVGAVAGALIGMGVPREEAEWYESEVKGGSTLVTVHAEGRYDEARTLLRRFGAYDVQDRGPSGLSTGHTSGSGSDFDLTSGRGTGGSHGTGSTTGNTDFDRSGRLGTGSNLNMGGTIDTRGMGGSENWDNVSSRYRANWQSRYGNSGGRWEDFEPGYRYAFEMRNRPEYRGRSWSEVEPDFRRDWESHYSDRPWDRFVNSIRGAWEEMTGSNLSSGHQHHFVNGRCECGEVESRRSF